MLLTLGDDACYGYKLHQRLSARGLDLHAASLYRRLRTFERDRWVVSHWSQPVDGPRRHVYRLTATGRATLHELSGSIAAVGNTYNAFLHAHEQALTRRVDAVNDVRDPAATPPRAPQQPTPHAVTTAATLPPPRPHNELLAGWLLLHLDAGATYGYDLRREVDAHGLSTDPSAIYRMLQRLETDKWVQSRWVSPARGPRRHFYRLTTRGRRNLDEIAVLIAVTRDSYDTYLREYERAHPPHDAPSASQTPAAL